MGARKMIREEVKKEIEAIIKKNKEYRMIQGRPCFLTKGKGFIRLDTIGGGTDCIVVEFAENEEEANNNRLEDGDLFPIYEGKDHIAKEILKEIEED